MPSDFWQFKTATIHGFSFKLKPALGQTKRPLFREAILSFKVLSFGEDLGEALV